MTKYKRITIICSDWGEKDLLPLIRSCRIAGGVGHTMNIMTDYDMPEYRRTYCFDGDGSSKILLIKSRTDWVTTLYRWMRLGFRWNIYRIKRIFIKPKYDGTDLSESSE